MNALEFLTPASASALARSPMERAARAAGATFEERDGWNLAVSFGQNAVGQIAFADRSHMVKLELQAEPAGLSRLVAAASGGAELKPGLATRAADAWWCPVTPSRVLVLGEPSAAHDLRAAVSDGTAMVVDVTSAHAALALIGPGARELLARFCAIDVRPTVTPTGAFRPGSVARTPGYLLYEDEQRLLAMVGWAHGEYLWDVVADAAGHLGGGPVGADTLEVRQLA